MYVMAVVICQAGVGQATIRTKQTFRFGGGMGPVILFSYISSYLNGSAPCIIILRVAVRRIAQAVVELSFLKNFWFCFL